MTVTPTSTGLVTYTLTCSQSGANALSASNSATIYVSQPSSGGGSGIPSSPSKGGGALGLGLLLPLLGGALICRKRHT